MKNLLPLVRKLLTAVPVAGLLLAVAVRHGHGTVNAPATGAETAQSGPRPMLGRHGGRLASPFAPWEGTGRPNAAAVDTAGLKQGAWYKTVVADIERKSYYMAAAEKGGASSTNHAQGLSASYTADGFTLSPLETPEVDGMSGQGKKNMKQEDWRFGLNIKGLYSDGRLACAPKTGAAQDLREGEADFHVSDLLTVQYRNTAAGVRQNFVVEKSPGAGTKELRVSMQVPKGWTVGGGGGELRFAKQNGKRLDTKIVYRDLKVWDAGNRPLVATMGTDGRGGVDIKVDAEGARYPVTIDPVSTTATTTLTGPSSSSFSSSLSSAGDVNGDGYGDVVIGGTTDKVFVYLGSSTGLSTTAAVTLNAPVAGGNYGLSVASAGDVNGDGYSDVVVGASSVSSSAGAAYIYMGSATGLSTTVGVTLNAPVANGTFGWSVATAGDVNGDKYSDVIIGSQANSKAYIYMGSSTGLSSTAAVTLNGVANGSFGYCVSPAGDVNGDGYSDVVVGDYSVSSNDGAAYIFMGSATGLSSTAAFTLAPPSAGTSEEFGLSVSSAGDVDGDGYGDIIISGIDYNGGIGRAFIYKGSATGISTTASTILPANSGDVNFGFAIASAGDLNGDGYGDVVVGVAAVGAYIYLGSATGISTTPSYSLVSPIGGFNYFGYSVSSTGDVDGDGISEILVGDLISGTAYIYNGSTSGPSPTVTSTYNGTSSSQYGYSVASAGDVNGDGYGDVVVGTFNGNAYLYMGSATGLAASPAVTLNMGNSTFGSRVASAGDVNGDGYGDVVVGDYQYSSFTGIAYVFLGSSTGLSSTPSVTLNNPSSKKRFGIKVASAGDVNGDGYGDIVVGSWGVSNDAGGAYVYLGSPTGIASSPSYTFSGPSTGSQYGFSVASAGDVNGDGYSDLLVGAYGTYTVYIYLGSHSGLPATASATLTGSSGSNFGYSVASAGDVNGDGYGDVVIGANGVSSSAGAAYVYLGSSSGLSTTTANTWNGFTAGDQFGRSVASAGDVNGDGYSDVVVGAPFTAPSPNSGTVYVYLGSASGLPGTASTTYNAFASPSYFGWSVASGGDVNGDGYSDVLVGAPAISSNTGAAYLYAGNGGYGKRENILRLYNTDLSTPVSRSNNGVSQFGIGLFVRPFPGATKARIVWETEPAGTGFLHHSPIANYTGYTAGQSSYTAIPAAGTELKSLVAKSSGKATMVRVRLQYLSSVLPGGQTFGPWVYPQAVSNGSGTVLPITLLSFNAVASGSGNLVAWQVAGESPNTFYDVERSADGVSFSKIGASVSGKGGNSSYTFHDGSPLFPVSYYRLKGTEADGHVTYSDIAAVQRGGAVLTITASPNPFTGSVTVTNGDASLNGRVASVVDMLGRTVATFTMAAQTVLDTKGWPAGMYVLRLPDGTTKKVVKQ